MTASPARPKLDALTSLRFFAAAMIVALHGTGYGIGPAWLRELALAQGVSFFFVLSGFVLAYNYPRLDRTADVGRFLVARVARIWPLHVVTGLLMVAFMAHVSYAALPSDSREGITLAYLSLTQSWVPSTDYILAYNGIAWSISAEWFFYLAFPFLVAGTPRSRWARLAFAFVLMAAMWTLATIAAGAPGDNRSNLAYFNPLARLFEFVLGIVACDVYRRHGPALRARLTYVAATRLELGVVALAVGTLWLSAWAAASLFQGGPVAKTASVVVGTAGPGALVWGALILVFALEAGALARLLGARVFVFLGEISFALYLVHMILLVYGQQSVGFFERNAGALLVVVYWGSSLALAALLHYAVERPWRTIIRRSVEGGGSARLLPRASAIAVVLVAVTATGVLLQPSWRDVPVQPIPPGAKVLLRNPVEFDAGFRLDEAALIGAADDHGPMLRFTWTATRAVSLDRRVAVHLLDGQARIVGQRDYAMDVKFRHAAQGERWSYTVAVPRANRALANVDAIGVAIYGGPATAHIADSHGVATDWDGHRLLVAVDGSGAPRFARSLAKPVAVAARATPQPPARNVPAQPMPSEARALIRNPVDFDAGFRLEEAALEVAAEGHGPRLHFTWTATRAVPLDRKVGVHLLDPQARILGQVDYPMDIDSARVAKGERWSYAVNVPDAYLSLADVDSLGIVIYGGAQTARVARGKGVVTDWNDQRLLVAIDGSGSPRVATARARPVAVAAARASSLPLRIVPPQSIPREAKILLGKPVEFDAGFRLEEAALVNAGDGHGASLLFTWTATRPVSLDRKVGVHLLDGPARIVGQMDYAMDAKPGRAAAGERWSYAVPVPDAFRSLEKVDAFGIVIYGGPGTAHVAGADDVATDWNGQRLLIALDGSGVRSAALPKATAMVPVR